MTTRGQLMTPTWALVPCAIAGAGLGYLASMRCRRAAVRTLSSDRGDGKYVLSETPHPLWVPGQKQPPAEGLENGHVQVDPRDLKSCYPLMISAVVPRPIAFVSTQSADGVVNVSPFSYFNTMGHDPPMLAVSLCRKRGGVKKDTLVNIEETNEFVVSIMSDWFIESANHTCGDFPPDVDEMEAAGLTPAKSTVVAPPRVKESAVNMECKVRHKYDIVNDKGEVSATVVFGEVLMFHVFPHLLDQNGAGEGKPTVVMKGFNPMARLGGNTYAQIGSVFDLPRPNVKK